MRRTILEQLTTPGGSSLSLASVTETHEGEIVSGVARSPDGKLYPIQDGILDLLPDGVGALSPAQSSNELDLVAHFYEWPWRTNSLTILSGEPFPFARERTLFDEMLDPLQGTLWLDLAASTALYGRWLAPRLAQQGGEVVSLDFAWPMLRQAQKASRAEGHPNLSFVRARAEALPFANGTLDGVVCGGSLNEFGEPATSTVLQEVARALRPDGVALFMHLLALPSGPGAALQQIIARSSGVAFWHRAQSNRLFQHAGPQVEQFKDFGAVGFTRLRKVGG